MLNKKRRPYWVIGRHAVELVLSKQPKRIRSIYMSDRINLSVPRHLLHCVTRVDYHKLTDMTQSDSHQGMGLICEPPSCSDQQLLTDIEQRGGRYSMLVLDNIQDPSNLGACLRTAAAMGVDSVVMTKQKSAAITATVTKVSCGASEVLPILAVANLVQWVKRCQQLGIWFYATSEHAQQSLYAHEVGTHAIGLVMGNEQTGISPLLLKTCDYAVSIPTNPKMPSLNVSVATGIALSFLKK